MKNQTAHHKLIDKLRSRSDYFAFLLFEYQKLEKMNSEELRKFLESTEDNYFRLAFCRVPDANTHDFGERISRIADYANIPKAKLIKIIRRVNAIHAISESTKGLPEASFLLAAREKDNDSHNK